MTYASLKAARSVLAVVSVLGLSACSTAGAGMGAEAGAKPPCCADMKRCASCCSGKHDMKQCCCHGKGGKAPICHPASPDGK